MRSSSLNQSCLDAMKLHYSVYAMIYMRSCAGSHISTFLQLKLATDRMIL
jgi:hypothetical protein